MHGPRLSEGRLRAAVHAASANCRRSSPVPERYERSGPEEQQIHSSHVIPPVRRRRPAARPVCRVDRVRAPRRRPEREVGPER